LSPTIALRRTACKTFTPKMGEINRIEIKVKPPPEVDK
jgi:hypothetical protein